MIGKTILHYRVLDKLGQGGMGAVYRAEDSRLRRVVALKFLPAQALADGDDKARFVHEAQAAAALHHPNICTVYEINEADEQLFISMAYLPGGSLKERIERGPLGNEEALKIAVQVVRGLQAAHDKGVVHRDIKPTNIMFSESGVATVMDFGLAKSKQQSHVTRIGTTMGTIAYMSPEQTRGGDVDHRTDIWSLGVMLYEMVAGQRPFRGDYDEAVIYSILNESPKPVEEIRKDVNSELAFIIRKAMAKDPADRYQTAGEMLEDLEATLHEIKIGSSKTRPATRTKIGVARRPTGIRRFLAARYVLPVVLGLAVVGAVSVIMLGGDEEGGVTETVAVVDEQGQTFQRSVPKSAFRRSFAIYVFDNQSGDPANDWLGAAIPVLLEMDLLQDYFLTIRSAFDAFAYQQLRRAGFERWEDAPWSIKRELALRSNLDYVVTGTVSVENDEYVVTKSVRDATTGRLVASKPYRGRDLFAVVDSVAFDLRTDVGLPPGDPEGVRDFPVAEMTTSSIEAIEAIALASSKAAFDQDLEEAIELFEKAARIDSTAAIAYFNLLQLYLDANQGEKVDAALERLMRHLYKLPERLRFFGKQAYYLLRKEPEKSFAVLRMMIDLYPQDIVARETLAMNLGARNRFDEAIGLYKEILDIDPHRTEFLQRIGALYRGKGDFARALEYYQAYAKEHPTNVESFTGIAELYEERGDFDRAMENYDKSLLLDPKNVAVLTAEAVIDSKLGRSDEALDKFRRALSFSRSPQDRIELYAAVERHFLSTGELERAFEQMRLKWAEIEKEGTPIQLMFSQLMDARHLIAAGRRTEAFDIIESVRKAMGPPYDGMVPVGYVYAYLELEEADSAEAALERLTPFIEAFKIEQLRRNAAYARGRIAEMRGDCREALRHYAERAVLDPTDLSVYHFIGRCQRKLGEHENAEASFEKTLKVFPNHGETLYELALLHADTGAKEEAVETLKKALRVWENADPEYTPAREAREKLAAWGAGTS
jgi:tetratricopeptide (TPR) repeat protein